MLPFNVNVNKSSSGQGRSKNNNGKKLSRAWARPHEFIIIGILVIVVLALLFLPRLFTNNASVQVVVYHNGEEIDRFELKAGVEREIRYPELPQIVLQQTAEQEIYFAQSDCQDKICIKAGKLSVAGQFAACLPNNFVIKIEPLSTSDDEGVDAIV